MGRIVVGVDGSEQSEAALQWAVSEARLRGAHVEAVYVYEPLPTLAYGYTVPVAPSAMDEGAQAVGQQAERLVTDIVARLSVDDEVSIEPIPLEDVGPAQALVKRSRDAELLVVGSRGRGGFQELLLGSISHQCANHASCPVVIVRHPA